MNPPTHSLQNPTLSLPYSLLCPPPRQLHSDTQASCGHLSAPSSISSPFYFYRRWQSALKQSHPLRAPLSAFHGFVFNVGIFYLPCCLLSLQHCRQDVTEKPLLAERKPQPCQGTQTPDTAAFPCHHWCALCGSLMLLYSSLSEGFEVPIQQKMDLDNHRKQKKNSQVEGKWKEFTLDFASIPVARQILISFLPLCVQAGE